MANITQTIPSYVQGISTQPDELKLPGQVRDLNNGLPDVAKGLVKRPGTRLIKPLTNDGDNLKWFSINRDDSEKYIGGINSNGTVKVWSLIDGTELPVYYSSKPPDLKVNEKLPKADYPYETPTYTPGWQPSEDSSTTEAVAFITPRSGPTTDPIIDVPTGESKGIPAYADCDNELYTQTLRVYRQELSKYNTLSDEFGVIIDASAQELNKLNNPIIDYEVDVVSKFGTEQTFYLPSVASITTELLEEEDFAKPNDLAVKGNLVLESVFYMSASQYNRIGEEGAVSYDEYEPYLTKGSIYTWSTNLFDQAVFDDLQAQEEAKKTELEAQQLVLDAATVAYNEQAIKCNVTVEEVEVEVAPEPSVKSNLVVGNINYLKRGDNTKLDTLTINDYTFIANPAFKPSMSGSSQKRPDEAFISLKTVKYNTNYQLFFNKTGKKQTAATRVYTATSLVVNREDWDQNGSCKYSGNEIFEIDGKGDREGLSFQLETIGQSVPKDGNPDEGYECQYTTSVRLLNGGIGWRRGDTVDVILNQVEYTIAVSQDDYIYVMGDIGVVNYTTPADGEKAVSANTILASLAADINDIDGMDASVIGSGIHVQYSNNFQIASSDDTLLNVFTESVNDVSKLPPECRHKYVVKVSNTEDENDDYYVQFKGHNNVDGTGYWEETIKPGIWSEINPASMPHQMVRRFDEDGNIYFRISPCEWEPRQVGDDSTNPLPSFIGLPIQKLALFRNRFVMLSDENVIMSRPGDYFNFFSKTALAVTPIDPIDVSTSSQLPSVLRDAIEVNAGLLCFSDNQQYLVTTDNDLFTSDTAKVNTVCTYSYNSKTAPVPMGTTVGFLNSAGSQSRFLEITNIRREGESEVLDQSKVVDRLIPNNRDIIAYSEANSIIMIAKEGEKEVWCYRYYNTGEKRIQSAWFKFTFTGTIATLQILDDTVYIVSKESEVYGDSNNYLWNLTSMNLIQSRDSAQQAVVSEFSFDIHLDSYTKINSSLLRFDINRGTVGVGESQFNIPFGYHGKKALYAWTFTEGDYRGQIEEVTVKQKGSSNKMIGILPGDRTRTRFYLGYNYEMKVELPTIYLTRAAGEKTVADTRSDISVHRCQFNFADVGTFEVRTKVKGRSDYRYSYEQTEMDGYEANDIALEYNSTAEVPIYAKNLDVDIILISKYPTPSTLVSMTWEGDVNQKFYKRV